MEVHQKEGFNRTGPSAILCAVTAVFVMGLVQHGLQQHEEGNALPLRQTGEMEQILKLKRDTLSLELS
jgi:hypothetical protein